MFQREREKKSANSNHWKLQHERKLNKRNEIPSFFFPSLSIYLTYKTPAQVIYCTRHINRCLWNSNGDEKIFVNCLHLHEFIILFSYSDTKTFGICYYHKITIDVAIWVPMCDIMSNLCFQTNECQIEIKNRIENILKYNLFSCLCYAASSRKKHSFTHQISHFQYEFSVQLNFISKFSDKYVRWNMEYNMVGCVFFLSFFLVNVELRIARYSFH